MRYHPGDDDEINRPVTHGLICDAYIAAHRVACHRQFEITHCATDLMQSGHGLYYHEMAGPPDPPRRISSMHRLSRTERHCTPIRRSAENAGSADARFNHIEASRGMKRCRAEPA